MQSWAKASPCEIPESNLTFVSIEYARNYSSERGLEVVCRSVEDKITLPSTDDIGILDNWKPLPELSPSMDCLVPQSLIISVQNGLDSQRDLPR